MDTVVRQIGVDEARQPASPQLRSPRVDTEFEKVATAQGDYPPNMLQHSRFSCSAPSQGAGSPGPMAPGSRSRDALKSGCGTRCISQISSRAAELHDRTVLGFATKMRKTRPPSCEKFC